MSSCESLPGEAATGDAHTAGNGEDSSRANACLKPRQSASKPRLRNGAVPHPPSPDLIFSVGIDGRCGELIPRTGRFQGLASGSRSAGSRLEEVEAPCPEGRFDASSRERTLATASRRAGRGQPLDSRPPLRPPGTWAVGGPRMDSVEQRPRAAIAPRRVGNRPGPSHNEHADPADVAALAPLLTPRFAGGGTVSGCLAAQASRLDLPDRCGCSCCAGTCHAVLF